jgi:hypothetical protein
MILISDTRHQLVVDAPLSAASYVTDISRRGDLYVFRPMPQLSTLSLTSMMSQNTSER